MCVLVHGSSTRICRRIGLLVILLSRTEVANASILASTIAVKGSSVPEGNGQFSSIRSPRATRRLAE